MRELTIWHSLADKGEYVPKDFWDFRKMVSEGLAPPFTLQSIPRVYPARGGGWRFRRTEVGTTPIMPTTDETTDQVQMVNRSRVIIAALQLERQEEFDHKRKMVWRKTAQEHTHRRKRAVKATETCAWIEGGEAIECAGSFEEWASQIEDQDKIDLQRNLEHKTFYGAKLFVPLWATYKAKRGGLSWL